MKQKLHSGRKKLRPQLLRAAWLIMACGLLWGCGLKRTAVAPPPPDPGCTERVVAPDELRGLTVRDARLTPAACLEILARLNQKDRSYIQQDIKNGKVLKAPNDYRAYLDWTPLPPRIERIAAVREFILVVKDIAFLGWYENGELRGDTQVCIGKKRNWTRSGWYTVTDKDKDHVSSSYRSAFGYPALMPFALRIYGRVWIHGGDVTGANCSHGCINLPLDAAEELYSWADPGATVLVVESLQELNGTIDKHSKRLKVS